MTSILRTFRRRLFSRSEELLETPQSDDNEKSFDFQYVDWINKRIRRECFFDNNLKISHWVPYLLAQNSVDNEKQLMHTWSSVNKSDNIEIKEGDPFTIHRNPISLSTDAARGRQGYSSGIHVWKVIWPVNQRGTHAVIGVATDKSMLQYNAYVSLVGLDTESWGWDIVNMVAVHDGGQANPIEFRTYPNSSHRKVDEAKIKVPDTVFVILDMDKGSMSFIASNKFLGVAHSGLKGKTLYPTISSVWGHCEISLRYFNNITTEPPSLKNLSLFVARKLLKYHCQYNQLQYQTWFSKQMKKISKNSSQRYVVQKLEIPNVLKRWLVANPSISLVS